MGYRNRTARHVAVGLAMFTLLQAGSSGAAEVVHFQSLGQPPSLVERKAAEDSGTEPPISPGIPIWGHLSRPEGPGPFPALVLMHGCSGIRQTHALWADWLNDLGYVTLILDSFGPRSVFDVCRDPKSPANPLVRALDAHGAHAFLAALPAVDADRIGVIGWSHGGISALSAIKKGDAYFSLPPAFRTAVAFYPYCLGSEELAVPTLILIGDADSWTPATRCRTMINQDFNRDAPLELVVYPGAHHAFDAEAVGAGFELPGLGGHMHRLQYDADARRDAEKRLRKFLEKHLSR